MYESHKNTIMIHTEILYNSVFRFHNCNTCKNQLKYKFCTILKINRLIAIEINDYSKNCSSTKELQDHSKSDLRSDQDILFKK